MMRNNSVLRNNLKSQIKQVLLNDEINVGEDEDEVLDKCVSFILNECTNCIDSKDLKIEDIDSYYIFQIWNEKICDKDFMNNLKVKFKNSTNEYNSIKMIFIVDNIRQQIQLESKIKELRNEVKKIVNKMNKTSISIKEIENETIFFNTDKKDCKINIESRIRSLEKDRIIDVDEEQIKIIGYVFTANLYDIVKMYNKLGNELFDHNIRSGIKDELNVDTEIKETLKNNPDEFWFLNNGITMLVQDDEFSIKKTKCLEVNLGKNKVLSIINGAQTITTSAEFFYENDCNKDNIKLAKDKAKVMLRVVHINTVKNIENQNRCKNEIKKISVALNRQKPIQPEDIAYTTEFVYKLNKIQENNLNDKSYFKIIRRGDHSVNNEYTLVDFAKATKAYLDQCPGEARSKGKKSLLEIQTENGKYMFKDEGVFKKELTEYNIDCIEIFNRYYRPMNFAMKLQDQYLKQSTYIKKSFKDLKKIAIINYGKWHFVAYVIFVLNNDNNKDFTKFDATLQDVDSRTMGKIIEEFVSLFSQSIEKGKDKLDSNDFKNEKIYNDFKKYENAFPNDKLSNDIRKFNEYIRNKFCDENFLNIGNEQIAATRQDK